MGLDDLEKSEPPEVRVPCADSSDPVLTRKDRYLLVVDQTPRTRTHQGAAIA
jgi:hypothetical protein